MSTTTHKMLGLPTGNPEAAYLNPSRYHTGQRANPEKVKTIIHGICHGNQYGAGLPVSHVPIPTRKQNTESPQVIIAPMERHRR